MQISVKVSIAKPAALKGTRSKTFLSVCLQEATAGRDCFTICCHPMHGHVASAAPPDTLPHPHPCAHLLPVAQYRQARGQKDIIYVNRNSLHKYHKYMLLVVDCSF